MRPGNRRAVSTHEHDNPSHNGDNEQEEPGHNQHRKNAVHVAPPVPHAQACCLQDPQRIRANGSAAYGQTLGQSVNITRDQAVELGQNCGQTECWLGPYITYHNCVAGTLCLQAMSGHDIGQGHSPGRSSSTRAMTEGPKPRRLSIPASRRYRT